MSDDKRDQRDQRQSPFNVQPIALENGSNGSNSAELVDNVELKQWLEHWRAPDVAPAHERRLVEAYRRQLSDEATDAAALNGYNSEVVEMKTCTTCHEEFADKFSFCPVDGTPLNGFNRNAADPVLTSVEEPETTAMHTPASGNGAFVPANGNGKYVLGDGNFVAGDALASGAGAAATMPTAIAASKNEYHLTMIEDAGLVSRLMTELREVAHASQLTWPEFKRDPVGFTRRSAVAYGALTLRFFRAPNVALASLIAIFTMIAAIIAIGLLDRRATQLALLNEPERVDQILDFTEVPEEKLEEKPDKGVGDKKDEGRVGFNKGKGEGSKPKFEKAQGGGGGGRQEQKPASQGGIPPASMDQPQIVTPKPIPPAIQSPRLPVAVVSKGDPSLFPPTTPPVFGVPNSKSKEPSSGPGTGDGIGNGSGNNIGSGNGSGYGKGEGYNIGGGSGKLGGGGSGGGTGSNGEENYTRVFKLNEVTQKYQILSKPEAQFTEEARKNNTQGTVRLRALLASNGRISDIRPLNQLPYGLTEKAIEAARKMEFKPSVKNGHPVSVYVVLEYGFNLY